MLLLNTPHNPTGKILSLDELKEISEIVKEHPDVVVVSDEVYEHLTYDRPHISIASLPGMWDRTITVSSAGKTFSVTGWKIGWTIGPEHLVKCVGICHQWVSFSVATPLQVAVANMIIEASKAYKDETSYYVWLNNMYRKKRTFMENALRQAGITPIVPEGGFFIVGDTSALKVPDKYLSDKSVTRDWALCRWLTIDIGVAAIPPSSFYGPQNKHLAANYARFAFCKPDDQLEEAAKRLAKLKEFVME